MTGKYPFEHGSHTFMIKPETVKEYPLDESFVTLAEALSAEGFATAAFTANTAYLDRRWKLDQGFDLYVNKRVHGKLVNKVALEWIETHRDESFFLFLNYMDTHSPYNTRKPSQRPDFLDHVSKRRVGPMFEDLTTRLINGEEPHPEGELQLLADLYDISIANTDEYMQELFDRLQEFEIYDDLLIVLTSDHGDYFGEHGLVEHGKDVYQGGLWIPLIVKFPNQQKGEIVEGETSSVDIPRLIFSRFPRKIAQRHLPHFSNTSGEQLVISENYFAFPAFWRKLHWRKRFNRQRTVVYDWPYKLIDSSDSEHELYDLDRDPDELSNLIEQQSKIADKMRERLKRFKSNREEKLEPGEPALVPTPEQIEELKALGYM
jgi:arylsulfatase A-like enzyme